MSFDRREEADDNEDEYLEWPDKMFAGVTPGRLYSIPVPNKGYVDRDAFVRSAGKVAKRRYHLRLHPRPGLRDGRLFYSVTRVKDAAA